MRQPHAAQHIGRLGELDVFIADNLDTVPPRIAEIEKPAGQDGNASLRQRGADSFLVVDDESEMSAAIGSLGAPLLQCEKLIAEVDEG